MSPYTSSVRKLSCIHSAIPQMLSVPCHLLEAKIRQTTHLADKEKNSFETHCIPYQNGVSFDANKCLSITDQGFTPFSHPSSNIQLNTTRAVNCSLPPAVSWRDRQPSTDHLGSSQQSFARCCDLLSFYYLCRTGNNPGGRRRTRWRVVICFHFTIFVVLETTAWKAC